MMRATLCALLALVLLAPASGALAAGPRCSAAGLPALAAQPRLPRAVATTRLAIYEAARRCDYEGLARLGQRGRPNFLYDWEHKGRPAAFWRAQEAAGKPMLATIAALLTLPATTGWPAGGYTWVDLTTQPRSAKAAFLAVKVLPNYHVTILADGDWIEVVIGD